MDLAYDHIVEESYTKDEEVASAATDSGSKNKKPEQPSSLNSDLQEAYKAFSSSPWGARIGGFLGNVVKQVR